jgi:FkbM family methyltransferase
VNLPNPTSRLRRPLTRVTKLARLLPVKRYRSGLRHGVAAAIEHTDCLRTLSCATVLDVGANIGQFALAARHCFPEARIVSFEPLAGPAETFRRVFRNDSSVELHQVAIGPRVEHATMTVSARSDSSSLLPFTAMQEHVFAGTKPIGTERVRVMPLADVVSKQQLAPPVLLKLDVQGFELLALQGCETMFDSIACIYVECSFVELYATQALAEDVIAFLRTKDFSLKGIYNVVYNRGTAIQGDFLFTRVAP